VIEVAVVDVEVLKVVVDVEVDLLEAQSNLLHSPATHTSSTWAIETKCINMRFESHQMKFLMRQSCMIFWPLSIDSSIDCLVLTPLLEKLSTR